MDGGRRPEIAQEAGKVPLASDDESEEEPAKGTAINLESTNLAQIAAGALAQGLSESAELEKPERVGKEVAPASGVLINDGEPMEDVKPTLPPITAPVLTEPNGVSSPDAPVKMEKPAAPGELPPILAETQSAITSGHGNPVHLPSIDEMALNRVGTIEQPSGQGYPHPQSPHARPSLQFNSLTHASPPKSPNDVFSARGRVELPSPASSTMGHSYYGFGSSARRPSTVDTPTTIYTSASEYNSNNTETPSTDDSASTPATTLGMDRMRIDNQLNPQIGLFKCQNAGCNAAPFQTQYLLNSHANVHSSARPHYCSVKGCPRSEGGKGFKRKNEMIRHGLVHDSPGYVCPFCPDREHKYPRPDNLQRHVRVHHTDKDKDDPMLREVLSQRPEGPSRGRRRRGGTS
ncbi:hypothetical protein B0O99DRAFT_138489 [Bisporella sp. PMI_857]|nr:hypothetical protein B0O99DRAFT_138489 [Bisporella sp. PMI_857]